MHTNEIAEIQARISRAIEQIEKARALLAQGRVQKQRAKAKVDELLGTISRLKAERTRLMMHQLERDRDPD